MCVRARAYVYTVWDDDDDDAGLYGCYTAVAAAAVTKGRRPEPYMAGRPRRAVALRPHRRRPENSVLCPPSHSHVWEAAAGIFGPGPFIKPPAPTSSSFISTSAQDQQPHSSRRPTVVVQFFHRKPVSTTTTHQNITTVRDHIKIRFKTKVMLKPRVLALIVRTSNAQLF